MQTKITLPLLFLLVCLAGSCLPNEDALPGTLSATLVKNRFFNLMESALIRTGLIVPLSNPNPDREADGYTLFAPTDEAFQELENHTGRKMDALQRDFLHEILQGHLHSGAIRGEELHHGSLIPMLNGKDIRVFKNGNTTYINGAKLIFTDAPSSNGVLHGLNKVIFNRNKSFMEWIRDFKEGNIFQPAELSIFHAAILKSGMARDLEEVSKFTVFAPSDLAFQKVGIFQEQDLENWSPQKLKQLLSRHIIQSDALFSQELKGQKLMTLANQRVEIDQESQGRLTFNFQEGAKSTNVILADISGNQGVIYIIDQVFEGFL